MLGYDDSLDVFGIHAMAGIVGSIGTGILVAPALGGVGVPDYAMGAQIWKQIVAVVVVILWTGIGSFILYKIVDMIIGLRTTVDQEREGLDLTEQGERAYNM
jgi:Amt family ammonium transporter